MNTTPWEEKAVWTTNRGFYAPDHFGNPQDELRAMTGEAALLPLSPSGMIVVDGEERVNFLHGLITNQIRHVSGERSIYAGLLTAQGRFLYDFTIVEQKGGFCLLTHADRANGLFDRLEMYRLRTKVTIRHGEPSHLLALIGPQTDEIVKTLFDNPPLGDKPGSTCQLADGSLLWRDPRLAAFGWRLLLSEEGVANHWPRLVAKIPLAGEVAWHTYRTLHALPQAGYEWQPGDTLPLEGGFLELNGVDFTKGCYVGQETTARTHHRGTLRKRLFMLTMDSPLLDVPLQSPLLLENGKEAGNLSTLAAHGMTGLAIVRSQDVAAGEPLFCGKIRITASKPPWATWQLS